MDKYTVTGMSCAACQARVEKAVLKLDGIDSCNVSLLTNTMSVEGSAAPEDIIKAVENAGYGAAPEGGSASGTAAGTGEAEDGIKGQYEAGLRAKEDALIDRETPVLRRRLIASIGFLLLLMYISMGHMMFGFPVPGFLEHDHISMGLAQMILAAIVMVINQKFFISGFKSLLHAAPNMDTLIALGSGAAFIYSTIMLFVMIDAGMKQGMGATAEYMNELYFESAAMILTLITVGKMMEAYSKGRTTDALKSLIKLAPKTACIIRDGAEVTVPIDEVKLSDIFIVKAGDSVPVDGIVLEGNAAIDESAITGESIPVDKEPGAEVTSATISNSGYIKCKATRVGEDTSIAQIIKMVSDAASTKAPAQKLADTISGYFVPVVIAIALITIVVWIISGETVGYALARGICVLVVSCPCALGLATPVAIMVGNGVGARNGILFKTAEALQKTGDIDIVVLDKTGTITKGTPEVTDIITANDVDQNELLMIAYSLEKRSEHPLARAVVDHVEGLPGTGTSKIDQLDLKDYETLAGSGVRAVDAKTGFVVEGGSMKHILHTLNIAGSDRARIMGDIIQNVCDKLASEGKTPLVFTYNMKYVGIIAVADQVKEDSSEAISLLSEMNIHTVMLSGDNRTTAEAIAKQVGIDKVIAEVLPEGKDEVIRSLQEKGRVAMVGDGINDAPALTRADIGIAIGRGTDVAIDAADVVLVKSSLCDVATAIRLSKKTYKNIAENLFWALIYNVILIPVAAGVYVKLFGITMNPMLGALAMSLSSFCVVSNALRLNFFKPHKSKVVINEKKDVEIKGDVKMTKTVKIEGMMCPHCEATVKKALEALDKVDSAEVSHEAGTAVISCSADVSDDVITKAVEDKDYKVISID